MTPPVVARLRELARNAHLSPDPKAGEAYAALCVGAMPEVLDALDEAERELERLRAIELTVRLFIDEGRAFAKSGLGVPALTTAQLAVVELLEDDLRAATTQTTDQTVSGDSA